MIRLTSVCLFVSFLCLFNSFAQSEEDRCTAIIVGGKASKNGSPMTTHTNDCSSCDFRLVKIPAAKHQPGSKYKVPLVNMDYPRYVGNDRGEEYKEKHLDKSLYNWTDTKFIGEIPQVSETYAYLDGAYGIINEHQVAIGESTCGGRLVSLPINAGGKALFDVSALSRLAMERTKTAREAIQLMGSLAEKYGYYGAEWEGPGAYGEAGEALTVTDPKEAWIFHIHPDDTGASAVWVAQRVPDDEMAAVANQFVIHQIDLTNPDKFMGSSNLEEVALRQGLWEPERDGPFDFTRAYAMERVHPTHYYSTRRIWRLFTLAKPSLNLSPYTDLFAMDYPFSVKPDKLLDIQDIMRFQRDHYEGTAFDMTKGPAAGPYGNPDRYDANSVGDMSVEVANSGHFERAISIFRASYSFVSELHESSNNFAKIWFGQYAPHATTYIPIYTKVDEVPKSYRKGSLFKYDKKATYWVHSTVGNWASRYYRMSIPYVQKAQKELEDDALRKVYEMEELMQNTTDEKSLRHELTKFSASLGKKAHKTFSDLFENLITLFHDGYHMKNLQSQTLDAHSLFYPKWWLNEVGYFSHPEEVNFNQALKKVNTMGPSLPMFLGIATTLAVVFTMFGVLFGRLYQARKNRMAYNYSPIH